ncbi:unnamed protein product [[Candida] boidinii]|uniref:Unnamed protein product n=1 Tax=Candida boidinii TaxID=5477 RepID=A0ACB5U4J0_CANBO|nr:unnamed protein product [[Candida] boidinii]
MNKIPLSPFNFSQLPGTPGASLAELLSLSQQSNGLVNGISAADSPRLFAALSENPSFIEQYQMLASSPAFNSMIKNSQLPALSPINIQQQPQQPQQQQPQQHQNQQSNQHQQQSQQNNLNKNSTTHLQILMVNH